MNQFDCIAVRKIDSRIEHHYVCQHANMQDALRHASSLQNGPERKCRVIISCKFSQGPIHIGVLVEDGVANPVEIAR